LQPTEARVQDGNDALERRDFLSQRFAVFR